MVNSLILGNDYAQKKLFSFPLSKTKNIKPIKKNKLNSFYIYKIASILYVMEKSRMRMFDSNDNGSSKQQ